MKTPSKEEIKSAWESVLSIHFFYIEKGLDNEGWYSNQRNGRWLPIQGKDIDNYDFRNNNAEVRPKSLGAQPKDINGTQSSEVMTLEECKGKIATDRGFRDWEHLCLRYLENATAFPSRKEWINSASDMAAELYASQYKSKADQLQAELEQVKAERDAMREALQEIVELPDLRFGDDYKTDGYALALEDVHRIANKALQSTKQ